MQKLISVSLVREGEMRHGQVEEHLQEWLEAGWKVKDMVVLDHIAGGGASIGYQLAGWVVVVLDDGMVNVT